MPFPTAGLLLVLHTPSTVNRIQNKEKSLKKIYVYLDMYGGPVLQLRDVVTVIMSIQDWFQL